MSSSPTASSVALSRSAARRFEGRTVLVTGGSSGIGLAAARAFASEGAQVLVTGRDEAALANAALAIGPGARTLRNDAARLADARALADWVASQGLRLDAIFVNAGIARMAGFADIDEAMWDALFDTNVKGAFFQLQALRPLLREGASIVLNGSINAHIGMPGTAAYGASKAALVSLARTLSAELLPQRARVNVVSPGPVGTPLYGKLGLDADTLDAVAARIQGEVPLGRFGDPAEIASTVLHLAAPESAFVVGSEIIVDGGMSQL